MDFNLNSTNSLNILNWNANGLKDKRSSFIVFLAQNRIDIACVTETHLISTEKFKIPGYLVYRFDRDTPRASGGVAIIIKRNISHHSLYLPYMNNLEVVAVKIKSNGGELIVYAAYHAPRYKFSKTYIENLFFSNTPTILLGDLNCKHEAWGCRKTNPNGRRLLAATTEYNVSVVAPNEPTHYSYNPNVRPDILDIGLFQNIVHPTHMTSIVDLDSDHLPVILSFNDPPEQEPLEDKLIKGIIDWEQFKENFSENVILPHHLTNQLQIDEAISKFTNSIQFSIENATVRPFQPLKSFPKTPQFILSLIHLKNKHRRLWQRYRTPGFRRRYNQLVRRVRWELDRFRHESYKEYISNLSPNDNNSLWLATKRILKEHSPIPSLIHNDQVYESKIEKANVLADYYQSTFQPNENIQDLEFTYRVTSTIRLPLLNVERPVKFTSPSEILHHIQSLKKKKAPGHDGIPNVILINLPKKGLAFLASLFNACLSISYFPKTWKKSIITVIHKPGKPSSQVESYRPISLLPTLSKLFEKIIKKRLDSYVSNSSLIPPHQFGFRSHHSTTHQLLRVSEDIINGFERRCHTAAVFLDVSQAFDRVWHDGLLFKLRDFGVPCYLQNIIRSFLEDRTFSVKIGGTLSSSRPIQAGVPQGAILSPLLFNIYTSDLPLENSVKTAVFADDTLVYSTHHDIDIAAQNVQESLDNLIDWFVKWRIAINPTKTEAKIFTLRRPTDPQNFEILGEQIPWNPPDQAIKYLGVYLDRRLNWKFHINRKLNLAYGRLSKLFPILNKKSPLSKKNGILLYKTLLRPLIFYACPVWGTATSGAIQKLQTFQNKVLRIVLKCPWYVRNNQIHFELGIATVKSFTEKTTIKFFNKLQLTSGIQFFNTGRPSNLDRLRLKPRLPQDVILV